MPLTVSLSPDHTKLEIELPSGHHVSVPAEAAGTTLLRLLLAQKRADLEAFLVGSADRTAVLQAEFFARFGVGTEPSPTQQELWHRESHQDSPVDTCPFCRASGTVPAARIAKTTKVALGAGITMRKAKRELQASDLEDSQ